MDVTCKAVQKPIACDKFHGTNGCEEHTTPYKIKLLHAIYLLKKNVTFTYYVKGEGFSI